MSDHPANNEEEERLAWEFALLGQNAFNWVLSGSALLAAAEHCYKRFLAALALHSQLYYRDSGGLLTAIPRPLTSDEVHLLPDRQLGPAALMLLAFAMENLAKGLMVVANPSLVGKDDGIASSLKHHQVNRLVQACGLSTTADEERCLGLLSQYATWAGRYPIPTKPLAPPPPQTAAHHISAPATVEWLWDNAQALLGRLREKLHKEYPHAAV